MRELLPLSTIHQAVLTFLRGRDDVVVFGAQAVNAYVPEPRMTQAIDLMVVEASALALVQELKQHLHDRFQIAVRIGRSVRGKGIACTKCNSAAIGIWWMYDRFQVSPWRNGLSRCWYSLLLN